MRAQIEQWSREISRWPQVGFSFMPTLQVHMRCIGGYAWLTRSFVQTKPRTIVTPSLRQRPDLVLLVEGRFPFHQETTRPSQIRRETLLRPNSHPMAHGETDVVPRRMSQSLTPWRRPIWMQRFAQRVQRPKQRPHARRKYAAISSNHLFSHLLSKLSVYRPSWWWFSFIVEPSFFSGLRRSTWIFFLRQRMSVSTLRSNSVSAIHSGTCRPNFWIWQDSPGAL